MTLGYLNQIQKVLEYISLTPIYRFFFLLFQPPIPYVEIHGFSVMINLRDGFVIGLTFLGQKENIYSDWADTKTSCD